MKAQMAAQTSTASLANAEVRRRIGLVNQTNVGIEKGYRLIQENKAAEALAVLSAAYEALPDVPLAKESRLAALDGYVVAGCMRAQELMAQGNYKEVDDLLDELLSPKVAPNDSRVLALKKRFADPDRFPPALTNKHVENVGEVQKLMIKANSFLEIGDPDKAISTFQDILRIDPTNSAARRGMEHAEVEKQRYYKAAYDHQRAKMLNGVDGNWEDPVPATVQDVSAMFGAAAESRAYSKSGREAITEKLRTLIFPKVDFAGATLDEVVELLRVRSRDLDPTGKGVGFVLNVPQEARNKPISLNLSSVPMEEVLRYVSEMCGVTYKVDDNAVNFVSISERNNTIVSRSFRVPPDFIQNAPAGDPAAAPGAVVDPFGAQAPAGGSLTIRRMGAKEFLEARGVTFPEGTSASYSSSNSMLMVRNTLTNMEIVELLVEQASKSSPKQVVVTVRMLEVNQTNLEELGYDWLLGGLGVNSDHVFLGGGTAGSGNAYSAGNFPFTSNQTIPAITVNGLQAFPAQTVNAGLGGPIPSGVPGIVNGGGGGPITSGLRSGSYAAGTNNLDSLLQTGSAAGSPTVAPGILSLAGVFTDPQFQGVLRGLSQKKGVDINATPSVTTKNGLKATVEITREFIYPTEFDPPQLPQVSRNSTAPLIATPTTPTAFEMRKTGIQVEVEPVIAEDGRTVELTITPSLTDFEGFVNYGSAIYSPSSISFLFAQGGGFIPFSQAEQLITPNMIVQPIFKSQKVTTAVKIYDGATVVLGGAQVQSHTMVNDKLPILGDLPFVGRFFQSNTKKTETKNIIIFVTVNVIDPSGQKINRQTVSVTQ